MLRRNLSIALVVVGLVVVGLAIASATVWRDSETVTASFSGDQASPLLVTAPGVLDVVSPDVTVKASAPDGGPVVLVVGREIDVTGWIGDAGHVLVTGLSSWTALEATEVDGPGEQPSPAGSDMWVAQVTGDGEATMEWADAPGRWSLIAATDGTAPAPSLSLTWQREVSTPFLIPGLVLGGVLLLAGVGLGIVAVRTRQEPESELDRDAIRERLGAIPPRVKPGRHAQGSRVTGTYAGTELVGADASGADASGAEAPSGTEADDTGSADSEPEGEGEAEVAGSDEQVEAAPAGPDGTGAPAEGGAPEEGDAAQAAEEPDAGGAAVESAEGVPEDDDAATAGETNPEGEKA